MVNGFKTNSLKKLKNIFTRFHIPFKKMAVLTIIVLCVVASVASAKEYTPLEYGMKMSNTAYRAVCWYEYLKVFPNTDEEYSKWCSQGLDRIIKETLGPFYSKMPKLQDGHFGKATHEMMKYIPSEYSANCKQYLNDREAAPPADESDTLDDDGNDYIYKAFAYCLIQTLRNNHGDEATEAVKSEIVHRSKDYRIALLERENQNRARHGAEPLTPLKDLNEDAQAWAEKLAARCVNEHSSDEESLHNGQKTGENLYSIGGADDSFMTAYAAAAGFYEEIKYYPYPEGFTYIKGDEENEELSEKIGHFTQTVWKDSKYVGYGYAYNASCAPTYTRYVVARYFPNGNKVEGFKDNVSPPKDA